MEKKFRSTFWTLQDKRIMQPFETTTSGVGKGFSLSSQSLNMSLLQQLQNSGNRSFVLRLKKIKSHCLSWETSLIWRSGDKCPSRRQGAKQKSGVFSTWKHRPKHGPTWTRYSLTSWEKSEQRRCPKIKTRMARKAARTRKVLKNDVAYCESPSGGWSLHH